MLLTCSVLYTSLVSLEVLLFSNVNWTVSSDHRPINMSVASLLGQMQIVPHSSGSSRPSFFTQKVQDSHFRPQSLRFRGRVVRLWGQDYIMFRHADLFLGGPGLPPEVVSARLNFSARGPKNLLLHDKNQACRALYYWPASQNLGVPYPK